MDTSSALFERAKKVLPGGVNSPVRAYRAVGLTPRFIAKADGSHIWDVDGNRYIDYVCSWGPMILGHNHPLIREAVEKAVKDGLSFGASTQREVEIAELMIRMVPNIEMVRMVNSGTEAVMSALRLARGATGRDKIIKFEGCYHGHSDAMLVKAGSSAVAEGGKPSSAGVPADTAKDTLTAQYNHLESVQNLFDQYPGQIACVIVEPVAANMGVVGPNPGFLEGLRTLCDKEGALLIFDEVITGFRLAKGGAQEYFGVKADIVTFGKIIGGGMPVGAYCGSRELMEQVALAALCIRQALCPATRWLWQQALPSFLILIPTRKSTLPFPKRRTVWLRACGRKLRKPELGCGSIRWAAWWPPSSLRILWNLLLRPPKVT